MSGTNSSQICYICGATPKEMNDVESAKKKPVNPLSLNYGLSIFHAWVRFFECLLHINYKLDFQTWQVSGDEKKKIFQMKKGNVQAEFRDDWDCL